MKAVQINSYGNNDVIAVTDQVTPPAVAAGRLLVKVYAAGVNPSDWKIRQGLFQKWRPLTFPATLGGDFSGVVTEISQGVTGFKVGDEVYGRALTGPDASGSFAEFLSVAAANAAFKPKRLSHLEAAAVPLAGVSAWQALVDHVGLQVGQKILIQGGAGGIGGFAVQIAKYLGAHVIATAGTNDVDYVRGLGADEVVDYQKQSFVELVRDVDAVFDTVGGAVYDKSLLVLKTGGIIVSMTHPSGELSRQDVRMVAQQTDVTSDRLAKLAALIDQTVVHVHVDRVFPLEQAKEALVYMETGRPRGKVVLEVRWE